MWQQEGKGGKCGVQVQVQVQQEWNTPQVTRLLLAFYIFNWGRTVAGRRRRRRRLEYSMESALERYIYISIFRLLFGGWWMGVGIVVVVVVVVCCIHTYIQ